MIQQYKRPHIVISAYRKIIIDTTLSKTLRTPLDSEKFPSKFAVKTFNLNNAVHDLVNCITLANQRK